MPGPDDTRAAVEARRPAPGWLPRPSPIEWLCLAAGLALTLHYAWLLDDAYIYFRYIDNLLFLGRGLVYNPGEYVEGYSSPLWLLLLTALRATELNFWILVRVLAAVGFVVFWALLVRLNRSMSPATGPVVDLPVAYLSFNYAVLCYFSSGTESPLVQIAAVATALLIRHPTSTAAQTVVALSPLVRHELAVPLAVCVLWVAVRSRRFPWRMVWIAAGSLGGWLVFRIVYYADLVPNTFHLKNVTDWAQGLVYLGDTLVPYHFGQLLAVGLAVALAVRARGRGLSLHLGERAMMIGTALLAAIFVIKIGGDSRHYRYLAFPFCLATCGLAGIPEAALVTWARERRRALATAVAAAVAWLSFAAAPRQLYLHPINLPGAQIVDGIGDAAHHRSHPHLPTLRPWHSGRAIERLAAYRGALAPAEVSGIETGFLCWDLYAHFDRRAIHNMGLTEPILARTEMPSDRPAHKLGLMPLAEDLAAIHRWWPGRPAPGMHRAAVDAGVAPGWVAANLEAIERIERRIYNDHDPIANLALAFSRPERIRIPAAREPGEDDAQPGAGAP